MNAVVEFYFQQNLLGLTGTSARVSRQIVEALAYIQTWFMGPRIQPLPKFRTAAPCTSAEV